LRPAQTFAGWIKDDSRIRIPRHRRGFGCRYGGDFNQPYVAVKSITATKNRIIAKLEIDIEGRRRGQTQDGYENSLE